MSTPVLAAVNVSKHFPVHGVRRRGGRAVRAVDDVSLALYPGRITALVGESGCGKSTLARMLAGSHPPTSGELRFGDTVVTRLRGRTLRAYVRKVQLILQDPYGSFNPVAKIAGTLTRAVRVHQPRSDRGAVAESIRTLLTQVSLAPPEQFLDRYPHELSGGQLQRVSIARALAAAPEVVIADEPVSSLDVSIRLGVLNLLRRLTDERRVAMLYVTHDIASARHFAEQTAVMYAGQIIETGDSEAVTQRAAHPYTQLLIASAPDPSRSGAAREVIDSGAPPNLLDPPSGCRFHPRCPFAQERCSTTAPPEFDLGAGHRTRCWLYADEQITSRRTDGKDA